MKNLTPETSGFRKSTSGEFVWCPQSHHQVPRVKCLDRPYVGYCGTCVKYPHRLRIRRGIGSEIVDCPATRTTRASRTACEAADHNAAYDLGILGTVVTRDICILVKPFLQCPMCPEALKR